MDRWRRRYFAERHIELTGAASRSMVVDDPAW
jgi:hypothetical protein